MFFVMDLTEEVISGGPQLHLKRDSGRCVFQGTFQKVLRTSFL